MDKKIAVLGDAQSIKGFAAIGFDTFPADEEEAAGKLLRQIADSDAYAVIYITDDIYPLLQKEIDRYASRITPAVLPIPSAKGNKNLGTQRLSSFVEKAVGSDIIFNN